MCVCVEAFYPSAVFNQRAHTHTHTPAFTSVPKICTSEPALHPLSSHFTQLLTHSHDAQRSMLPEQDEAAHGEVTRTRTRTSRTHEPKPSHPPPPGCLRFLRPGCYFPSPENRPNAAHQNHRAHLNTHKHTNTYAHTHTLTHSSRHGLLRLARR